VKVTVLGCGGSGGVPAIGNLWGVCDPANPRNRRRRCSVLVEARGQVLLVDTSPDCREQLLDAGVARLDAVLYTHAHADHLHGIDELRGINRLMRRPVPIWADRATLRQIEQRFGYTLKALEPGSSFYKPTLEPHEIAGPFRAAGLEIVPFEQDHGFSTTLGFRIGGFGYSTDVVELDERAFAALDGVELWIVDCLRREKHPTHSHLEKTLRWIERVKPRRAILTHMDPVLDYATLRAELPQGVEPGYDGLAVELADPPA
jgi:phosphoribosyl 1,2-cyclic phosphate phosphodiesterase